MEVIGTTPNGTEIAAWMVKANPKFFDVGTAIATAGPDESWTWTLAPSYRVDLIGPGQLCFVWVTQNSNPNLVSGIWIIATVTGEPYMRQGSSSELWHDTEKQRAAVPVVPLVANVLMRPVTREELAAHPVLRDLEVLRAGQMSNPQVVTPEQLEALQTDFSLATGDIGDALRDLLRTDVEEYPIFVVLPDDDHGVEVYENEDGSLSVIRGDEEEEEVFATWQAAYRRAAEVAQQESLPVQGLLANAPYEGGDIAIVARGPEHLIVTELVDGMVEEWAEVFEDLASAVEEVIRFHEDLEGAEAKAPMSEPDHAVSSHSGRVASGTLISIEQGNDVVASILRAAGGEWMSSQQLRDRVLDDPTLGPLIRQACEQHEGPGWKNPRLRAGNVIGWWGSSWTRGGNAYIDQFERDGPDGGPYRYRLKTTPESA